MDCPGTTRTRWLAQLLCTDPADRARAEAAVRDLYTAAGFAVPEYFAWFDSPLRASWAVALLLAPYGSLWGPVLEGAARAQRDIIDQVRAELCRALREPNWDRAAATAGPPMDPRYSGQTIRQVSARVKYLQSEIIAARMRLHPDGSAVFARPAPSDELYSAESALWGSASSVLCNQSSCAATGSLISGSVYSIYSFSMMATDESAASPAPPALLAAAWEVARSAGPWWAFQHLAVLADRPLEVHVNQRSLLDQGDGPAAIYRDGEKVYAWNGRSLPEKWILDPESIPASQWKHYPDASFREYVMARAAPRTRSRKVKEASAILKASLPRDHELRLTHLREFASGRLPLYERYVAGEHKAVWDELMDLGAAVREDGHAADALAVAYETMDRVAANARHVVERLQSLNYQFHTEGGELDAWAEQVRQHLDVALRESVPADPRLRGMKTAAEGARTTLAGMLQTMKRRPREYRVRALVPPDAKTWPSVLRLEKQAGTLPLSLRAFYDVVGAVDLMGRHPALSPGPGARIAGDPLMVVSAEDALAASLGGESDTIFIAPDDIHKAGESGGEPYEIGVPETRADGQLLHERHNLRFVGYLRLAFRFGGFPGFEGLDSVPAEIDVLREGLLEF